MMQIFTENRRRKGGIPPAVERKPILKGMIILTDEAKEARREYMRRWRRNNRDAMNQYAKAWRDANPDKVRGYRESFWERKAQQTTPEGGAT